MTVDQQRTRRAQRRLSDVALIDPSKFVGQPTVPVDTQENVRVRRLSADLSNLMRVNEQVRSKVSDLIINTILFKKEKKKQSLAWCTITDLYYTIPYQYTATGAPSQTSTTPYHTGTRPLVHHHRPLPYHTIPVHGH